MAGGRGERFWPAGRRNKPKQFLPLVSGNSLIEETVQRLFPLIAPEKILVITNRDFAEKTHGEFKYDAVVQTRMEKYEGETLVKAVLDGKNLEI